MIESLVEKMGRRRTILLLLGVVWMLIGLSLWTTPPPQSVPGVPHTYFPLWFRVGSWMLCGGVAVLATMTSKRWLRVESLGYAALYIMPAERALSYLISWINVFEWIPGEGYERGWLSFLQYSVYVGVIYICAGWFENRERVQ